MRDTQKITLIAILILLLSQAFMIVLVANSFEKIHVASELARYTVPQKDFKRQLEGALRFGKTLDNLLGMDKLIARSADSYDDLTNIVVFSAYGDVLYSLHPVDQFPAFLDFPPGELGKTITLADPLLDARETPQTYQIAMPLFGPGQSWMGGESPSVLAGTVVFAFSKQNIRDGVRLFWQQRLLYGLAISAVAALALFLLLRQVREKDMTALRRKIFFRVLLVTILAQIAFSGLSAHQFHHDHVRVLTERVEAQLDLLRQEVERVLARGISLERVSRMDEYLLDILENNPEVARLDLQDAQGAYLAQGQIQGQPQGQTQARPQGQTQARPPGETGRPSLFLSAADLTIVLPVTGPDPDIQVGSLRATLNAKTLHAVLWKILLDSLTVALIASLFIVEQIYFLVSRIRERPEKNRPPNTERENLDTLLLARFAAFAFLFAFALPVSFVPLQMRELYAPMWGLPKDLVLGLPISLEMLCALLASLVAGATADRRGWRPPFLAGVLVTAAGLFFCSQADNGLQYILARGVCGLGYGLSWMSLQTFLFTQSTPSTRAQGSSHFVAGIFSGHICGTALGGMLAERLGFSAVFLVGAILMTCSLALFFLFMRRIPDQAVQSSPALVEPRALLRYLTHRNTFALIFCCVIPFSICQVGLLFFATPLYLNQLGVNQSDIGRVLMIYGLSVVYLAPQISKIVDRRERKTPFIVAGGLVGGLGLALLTTHQGFVAVMAAIFLLGVASSIGSSAQTAFALKSRATQELGPGKAMAIQRSMDKLGQMLGPILLGLLMSGVSIAQGLVVLGLGYMLLSGLFLVLARERGADG
ncbi:MFS transporter [Desulfonatronum thiodismutans]|uniref:MFS transporter n=1 Tax=Desulfonatronum thiodismutans TaxID=159290 RepID=UPI0004ABD53C|nr:MFS transporter [Desulfonatronum thiodismutans]